MCEDCAEEAEKKALEETLHKSSGNSAPQQNKIPPVMPSNHPTEPITITPIKSGNDNKDKYLMAGIVAVVLLIIVGGAGMWYIGSKDEAVQPSPVVETVSQTSENQQETPPSNSSSVRQPATQVRPESNVQAETPAPAAQVTEKEVKQEKPDPFAQGKQAYEAQNYSAAKIFLEQAFNEGSPQAGYYLAQLYMKGNGVSKSVQKAFDNMKVAAEGGYKEAFFELAEMYRLGIGTEPNRALAQKWYEESVKSAASNADKAGKALSMFN